MIEVRQLVKAFGPKVVLRGLNFDVGEGEFVALLGPNGAGKTTFLRILATLSRPKMGKVVLGGWQLPSQAGAVRRILGVVSHQPLLYGDLSAEENLRFYARMYGLEDGEARIAEVLRLVGLHRRRRDLVREFSRGMQQRLAIGRAILHRPKVLLFDEPHTGLDQEAAGMLDGLLREVAAEGRTVVMTSHDLLRAARLAIEAAMRIGWAGRLARYLRSIAAIVWKDVVAEFRSRELLGGMLVFALLVILIFNFALELNIRTRESVATGVLWVTFAFAGTLGLNRSMAMEKDRGSLDGLLLAPVDRSAIYFGKALGNLLFMLIVEAIVIPTFSVLYNLNLLKAGLLLVVLLGSVGYIAVGTLLSSMAVQARTRDVILLFPVAVPVLLASVKASNGFLIGLEMVEIWPWLNLLIAYDVIFIAVAFMVFDFIVEE